MTCRVEIRADFSAAMEVLSNPSCTVSATSDASVILEAGNYYADAYDLIATLSCRADHILFDGHPNEITVRVPVDGATIDTGQGRNSCDPIPMSPATRTGTQAINVTWEFIEPEASEPTGLNQLPDESIAVTFA